MRNRLEANRCYLPDLRGRSVCSTGEIELNIMQSLFLKYS